MNYLDDILRYRPEGPIEEKEKQIILDYIRLFPDTVLTRENEMGHLTSSGFVVNKSRDKVLFIFHNIYQSWAWTGGHADGDTDMLYVAMKEVTEESGVKNLRPVTDEIITLDILPVFPHMKKGLPIGAHMHLNTTYLLEADEEETLTVKPDENSGVRWLPADSLAEFVTEPEMLKVYNKILHKMWARGL